MEVYISDGHMSVNRCLRMAGDTILSGSDDWTVRSWSISNGSCDSVLTCHAGAITSVEYCASDRGIITGLSIVATCFFYVHSGILGLLFERSDCLQTACL